MDGTKNSDIRVNNRKRLINTLFRQGAMTKTDLARYLNISIPTATVLINELVQKGLVVYGEVLDSTGGRKPVLMEPVYDLKYAVGVEVSIYDVRMVLLDIGGSVHDRELYSHGKADFTEEFWKDLNNHVHAFINKNLEDPSKLLNVNLTIQMPIDHDHVCLKKKDGNRFQIDLDMIRQNFDYPVEIMNSARMAATAQVWSGLEEDDFVFLSIGTYVSGCIVYDRRVLDFNAPNGMFGSIIVGDGHLEDYLSINALSKKAGVGNMDEFFEKIRQGHTMSKQLWQDYLEILMRVIYNLRKIFGYRIIIGGAICPYLEQEQKCMNEKLCEMEEFADMDQLYFKVSDLGVFGASMGAAMSTIDHFLDFGFEDI